MQNENPPHTVFAVVLCLTRIVCYILLQGINITGSLRFLSMFKMAEILKHAVGQVQLFVLTGLIFQVKRSSIALKLIPLLSGILSQIS